MALVHLAARADKGQEVQDPHAPGLSTCGATCNFYSAADFTNPGLSYIADGERLVCSLSKMNANPNTHSKVIGYLLWIFGFTGSHRFYFGKPVTGTIWFFTGGLAGSSICS
jgi:hypothetical protein